LSYTFNRNETSHKIGADAIYGGWYVQPTAGVSQTWNRAIALNRDTSFYFNELNARVGARVPFNFSGGKQFRFLTLSSTLNNQQVNWTGIAKNLLTKRNFNFVDTRLNFVQQIQKARQHIYPRLAQTLFVQHRGTLGKVTANQLLLSGGLYLPGVHTNHNLVLTAAYQGRDTMNQYQFSNNFPFSRGYTTVNFPRMWKLGANYHFPLLYPDLGFGNIVYFNRVRANGFYDYTLAKSLRTGATFPFSTVGAEIFFDTKWWNQQEVTFGIRYNHQLNDLPPRSGSYRQWEIILPVDLIN
jgi:hypothetical protein